MGQLSADDHPRYQHYYKWIYFLLFSSHVILLTPKFLWMYIENGRLKRICGTLANVIYSVGTNPVYEEDKSKLVLYLRDHLGHHTQHAYGFVFCEILNVVAAASLAFLWDLTADNAFSKGAFAEAFRGGDYTNTLLSRAFPIMGKCTFPHAGPGGNVIPHDFVCLLPLNVANEKAAVFFW